MSLSEQVRRFYDSFNAQDLDGFAATLHSEAELQTARGLRFGPQEAREWATKTPVGSLDQRLVIDELREAPNHVLCLGRKQWRWRGTDEVADDEEIAALFTFDGELISRWQPFADRAEAIALFDKLARRSRQER